MGRKVSRSRSDTSTAIYSRCPLELYGVGSDATTLRVRGEDFLIVQMARWSADMNRPSR